MLPKHTSLVTQDSEIKKIQIMFEDILWEGHSGGAQHKWSSDGILSERAGFESQVNPWFVL